MAEVVRNKYGNILEPLGNEDATKQEKGLVENSDVLGLAIGSLGPISRTVKNAMNSGNMWYKPANAGWGAFAYEQGIEQAVQNQVQNQPVSVDNVVDSKQAGRVPMFTLRDMMDLQKAGKTDPIADEQFKEAAYGGYLLSRDQAVANAARKANQQHAGDGDSGDTGIGLPAGKLPSHVTFGFGGGSPYAQGLAAQKAGKWIENEKDANVAENWTFAPNVERLKSADYKDELARYYDSEYGRGINSLQVGDKLYTHPSQLRPATEAGGLADMVLLEDKYRQLTKKDA